MVLLVGTVLLAGVSISKSSPIHGEQVSFDLVGATLASVKIKPGASGLKLRALPEKGTLLSGTVPFDTGSYIVTETYDVSSSGEAML